MRWLTGEADHAVGTGNDAAVHLALDGGAHGMRQVGEGVAPGQRSHPQVNRQHGVSGMPKVLGGDTCTHAGPGPGAQAFADAAN